MEVIHSVLAATGLSGNIVVLDVRDADTFQLALAWDDRVLSAPVLRLADVDSPEMHTPEGAEAREWTVSRLLDCQRAEVWLYGWTFDRRVARVLVDGTDLSLLMVDAGHARYSEK